MAQVTGATGNHGGQATSKLKLLGMDWPIFLALLVIVVFAMHCKFLPSGLAGQLPLLMVLGEALLCIGDRTPIIKKYLGGGPIVVLFGGAALVMCGFVPEETAIATKTFMVNGFIDFAIASLCCGCIFMMERRVLVKSAILYIPCIIGGIITALLFVMLLGYFMGFGFTPAVVFFALPVMGSGVPVDSMPISRMFAEIMQWDMDKLLAVITPVIAIGNVATIIAPGFWTGLAGCFLK
jgi:Na+/citrate or Na+/malate symporter